MDIAAMSISMHSASLQQSAGIAIARKTMDQQEIQMQGLVDMMASATPPSSHRLDVRA